MEIDHRVQSIYMYFLDPETKKYYDTIYPYKYVDFLIKCLIATAARREEEKNGNG